jgi:mono/diheme cytochrome c family protein
MKHLLRISAAVLLLTVSLTSCYYDKEDVLYPSTSCDTATVTYSQTINPIMVGNCNICHSKALANGGVVTDNWDSLSSVARRGKLWPAVSHTGPKPMPQGADKLSDCNLGKIKKWINEGSLNN